MNIDLLNQELEVSENPGLDTFDPRFTDIATMVQEADYAGAARQAEKIMEEGIYDIRIICYFLYGAFIEQGVGALGPVFSSLTTLLTQNWEAVGPAKKREKHAQNSLKWFVNQLSKKLEYEENKKGDDWNAWLQKVSSEEVREALEAGETFQRNLGMTLEDKASPVIDGLVKVKNWLNAFERLVYVEPEPEPEPEPEFDSEEEAFAEDGHEDEYRAGEEKTAEVPAASAGMLLAPAVTEGAVAEGSYHLKMLLDKLDAFERLIQGRKFPLAALVADDINDIIANFDPKVYFPKIFAGFSRLFALNIGDLRKFRGYEESLEWQALQELYKVDLESFTAFEADLDFSRPVSEDRSYESAGDDAYAEEDNYTDSHEQVDYDAADTEW